jgi:hypothetical protein
MVHELRNSAILVSEVLIQLMLHKELFKPYFGKKLQQYDSQTIICGPLLTAAMLLEQELNFRRNLQNFSFKLQEFVFFFFYCRYNPLWVLAFSVIFFHCALSSQCFLHRFTPIICKSSSMPAIHLFRGLPLVLVSIGFHCIILLGVLLSSIRIT